MFTIRLSLKQQYNIYLTVGFASQLGYDGTYLLEPFTVRSGGLKYRFRVINTGMMHAFRISIDQVS